MYIKLINMVRFKYLLLALLSITCLTAKSQIYWGYSDNSISSGVGIGQNVETSGAIYIPAEVAKLYEGKNATAVRLGLNNVVSNLKIFITKDLNEAPLVESTFGSQSFGVLSFNFDEAYTIDGEGFYVGYTCTGTNPLGRSNVYNENGCWIKDEDGVWKNFATDERYMYDALTLAVRIEGSTLPFDARLIADNEVIVAPNEDFSLDLKLENLSKTAIRKYEIKYNINGGEDQTISKSVYLQSGSVANLKIDIPGFSEVGEYDVKLQLVSVNDKEDDYAPNNTVNVRVKVSNISFVKRMVVEKGTASWCTYCPKGIVAFDKMDALYPDNFIGIAVHKDDDMSISEYDELIAAYFPAIPRCIVNRNPANVVETTFSNLNSLYKAVSLEKSIVSVETEANLDTESKKINAKASLYFATGEVNADYRISFVVLEDSIAGLQNNYYSGGAAGEMGGFENMPSPAPVKFNHVPRGLYDFNGIEGSIPSTIVEDENYVFEKEIDLPYVKNKNNLSIVALVINAKTGLIENGAKNKITIGTGVESLEKEDIAISVDENGNVVCSENGGQLDVFNINGVKVSSYGLERGVYIVRYTDVAGKVTVEKIIY